VAAEVQLCNSNLTEPKWFEHPSLGRKVDVAALDVTEAANGFQIDYANELESDAVLDPTTSQGRIYCWFPVWLNRQCTGSNLETWEHCDGSHF
jgi:hypothetical protein